jgi:hypothetical protein
MKSFSVIVYVAPAVRSTGEPVHEPSVAPRTARVTRLPAGAVDIEQARLLGSDRDSGLWIFRYTGS